MEHILAQQTKWEKMFLERTILGVAVLGETYGPCPAEPGYTLPLQTV